MKRVLGGFFCILLAFYSLQLHGNEKDTSQLRKAIYKEKDDSVKVNLLLDYVNEVESLGPDTQFYYLNKAKELANQAGYLAGEFDATLHEATIYGETGDLDKVEVLMQGLSQKLKKSPEYIKVRFYCSILTNLANATFLKGKFTEAIDEYKKVFQFASKHGQSNFLLGSSNMIGTCYSRMSKLDSSFAWYSKALTVIDTSTNVDPVKSARFLFNYASLYKEMGDYLMSSLYFHRSYNIIEKEGMLYDYILCVLYLSENNRNLGDIDAALQASKLALDTTVKLNNPYLEAHSISEYVRNKVEKEDFSDTDSLLSRMHDIAVSGSNTDVLIEYYDVASITAFAKKDSRKGWRLLSEEAELLFEYEDQAMLYLTLTTAGEKALEFYPDAAQREGMMRYGANPIEWLQQAVSFFKMNGYKLDLAAAYEALGKHYLKTNQSNEAEEYLELAEEIRNDLKSQTNEFALRNLKDLIQRVQDEKALLNAEKKAFEDELKIKGQSAELANNRLYLSILFLLIVMAVFAGYAVYQMSEKQKQKIINEERLAREEAKTLVFKNKAAEKELELKRKEMTTYSLILLRKNAFLNEILGRLKIGEFTNEDLISLRTYIINVLKDDQSWDDFKLKFDSVFPDFTEKLNKHLPDSTSNERKLVILLRMDLSSKEIAEMLNISPASVDVAKARLKKRLQLGAEENLGNWLKNL